MRIYLDSNVFISLFERETGKNIRGLFVEAEVFFDKVVEEEHCIVLSDWFFTEVRKITYLTNEEIIGFFEKNNVKIEVVPKMDDYRVATKFSSLGIHSADAIHIALALHFKCDCIVTFNLKDFRKAEHLIRISEPGEF